MKATVLVVDDEKNIAEGIRFLIEKHVPECQVAGIAFSGTEGIAAAKNMKPDIILTDIRMADMDGLTMIKQIKEKGLQPHFIVISGYAEFGYARTAIHLGVEEYITKPVEEEELSEAVRRCIRKIEDEREDKSRKREMEMTIQTYGQDMMEYRLKDLLTGAGRDRDEILSEVKELGFPVDHKSYACVIVDWGAENGTGPDRLESLKKLADKELSEFQARNLIPYEKDGAILILAAAKAVEYKHYIGLIRRIRLLYEERIKAPVSCGASLIHSLPGQIRDGFEEARCALNYKVIQGGGTVISYEEIRNIDRNLELVTEAEMKQLERFIDEMDDVGCQKLVTQIFSRIEKNRDLKLEDLQQLSLNLVLMGVRKMPLMQFQINEYLGRNIFSLESIAKFKTIEQLQNWIINMLKGMNELMLKENVPEKKDVIQEAKLYIKKNFNKDISLNDISERFYINPYYFSQLFKKKTGETYQTYLTNLRISRAKKLLEETDLKIYEVCAMVGYTDTNHFNKVFERNVGMKPSEYKKTAREH